MSREITQSDQTNTHGRDTSIERCLCRALWRKGYRYRKNCQTLPGSPNIVLTKYKIAIFCDSEFFHGKNWEILKLQLKKENDPDFCITRSAIGRTTKNFCSWDIR